MQLALKFFRSQLIRASERIVVALFGGVFTYSVMDVHCMCVCVQVLTRSGSVDQQHHFIDLLDLTMDGANTEGLVRGNEKNCVKLRGLPYSATAEEVITFFGELGSDIAPKGVHMVLNPTVSAQELFSNGDYTFYAEVYCQCDS